jgi:hypothetical protein
MDKEKRASVKQIRDLRQVSEDGRTVPLKLYNETWNDLHKQARDISATTLGIVKVYTNKSIIGA